MRRTRSFAAPGPRAAKPAAPPSGDYLTMIHWITSSARGEQRFRDGKADGLGGLEVDHQLDIFVGACTGKWGFSPRRMRSMCLRAAIDQILARAVARARRITLLAGSVIEQ